MKKWFKNWIDAIKLFRLLRNNSHKLKMASGIWGLVDECVEKGEPRMAKVEFVGFDGQAITMVDFWVCPSPGSPRERISQLASQRDELKAIIEKLIITPGANEEDVKHAKLLLNLFK